MEGPLRMGVILASVRDGRRGEPFARWIHALAAEREGLFVELLDLREWALPAYARKDTPNVAEKAYAPDSLEGRWRAKIDSQDAFVVVTPEYNHSFPGQLKNALDAVYARGATSRSRSSRTAASPRARARQSTSGSSRSSCAWRPSATR